MYPIGSDASISRENPSDLPALFAEFQEIVDCAILPKPVPLVSRCHCGQRISDRRVARKACMLEAIRMAAAA